MLVNISVDSERTIHVLIKFSPCDILEKTSKYGIRAFHLFVEFSTACGAIRINKLLEALEEFKMPQKLDRLN